MGNDPAARAAVCAVLAGGRSARLGRPKATAPLADRPLISYPIAAAREAGLDVMVVAKPDSELPELGVPVVHEPAAPHHPLCGIVAALRELRAPIVALGCDMPFVPAELLAYLAALPEPAAVCDAGEQGLQPLLARYEPSVLPELARALGALLPLREAVWTLGPRVLGERELARFGEGATLAFNVNDAADLAAAEARLAPPPAPPSR